MTSHARYWAIPLRVIVGYGFMAHGYAKLSRGAGQFAAVLHALGVPMPDLAAWLTIGIELAGGAAILAGALLPLVTVPLAAVLVVAVVTVHLPYGFSSIKLQAVSEMGPTFGPPGYETALLYLAALAALVMGGPGPFALGNRIGNEAPPAGMEK
jgi:putative oxidoreductase